MTEPNPDDAAIAEFHRAARKRKAWIFAIAGVVAFIGGLAAVVLTLVAGGDAREGDAGAHYEIRTLVLGGALLGSGAWAAWQAWRIGSGQINDIDS